MHSGASEPEAIYTLAGCKSSRCKRGDIKLTPVSSPLGVKPFEATKEAISDDVARRTHFIYGNIRI